MNPSTSSSLSVGDAANQPLSVGRNGPPGQRGLYITLAGGVFHYGIKSGDSIHEAPRGLSEQASLQEIERLLKRVRWFRAYCFVATPIGLLSWLGGGVAFLVFLAAIAGPIYLWDRRRRVVLLNYDVPVAALGRHLGFVDAVGQWLSSCHALWSLQGTPSQMANRQACSMGRLLPPNIRCNVGAWVLQQGTRTLIFLPERILILEGTRAFGVPYPHLTATGSTTRVVEQGSVPADAQRVGSTWRFARLDGGPDLRFNNNVQLPVVMYGTLELRSPTSPFAVLQLSRQGAAEGAAAALAALAALSGVPEHRNPRHAGPPVPTASNEHIPAPSGRTQQAAAPRSLPPLSARPGQAPPRATPEQLPRHLPQSDGTRQGPTHATAPVPLALTPSASEPSPPNRYGLPPPPTQTEVIAKYWAPWGTNVHVAGLNLGGGLYVGSGLGSISKTEIEPALIDPRLRVNVASTDCSVRRLDYWACYSTSTPEARGAYLHWLASGRNDPGADLGYVFLYFYGLERRALADLAGDPQSEELVIISSEVQRLLGIYAHSSSFRSYASSLLNVLGARNLPERAYASVAPPLLAERELTFHHRLALAQVARDGAPLPADWAYAWLTGSPDYYERTPATRCPTEFRRLFIHRYCEKYGHGMKVGANKTRLRVEHQPASRTFRERSFQVDIGLADVSVLSAPVKRLQEIADACYEQLDTYSRTLGKSPELEGKFDAVVELPIAVWPVSHRVALSELREAVAAAEAPTPLTFANLKARFPGWTLRTKQKMERFAEVLDDLGLGIEPDARLGGGVPSEDGAVALFLENAKTRRISPAYQTVMVLLQLGAAVANADGVVTAEERQTLHQRVETWPELSRNERQRLRARAELLLLDPPKLTSLKKQLAPLSRDDRQALGDFLTLVAQADSHIDPTEMKMLEKTFNLLGLDAAELYSRAHSAAALGPPAATPPDKKPANKSPGPALDLAKVRALQADTERVSGMLGAIFAEDEPEPAATALTPAEETASDPSAPTILPGLDPDHSAFARILLTRLAWSRAEVTELSTDRQLLLDGALERINEAAFDTYSFPFCEGEDPIELTPEIIKELQDATHQSA